MPENQGAREVVEKTVDVTSLSNGGHHVWDPTTQTAFDDPQAVRVIGQEDPSYHIEWDHVNGDRFHVTNVSDGTDVTSSTDIGEVRLQVEGRR